MEAIRNMKMNKLKARIARSDYEVDADAVAEAIVRRLTAARTSPSSASPRPAAGGPSSAGAR